MPVTEQRVDSLLSEARQLEKLSTVHSADKFQLCKRYEGRAQSHAGCAGHVTTARICITMMRAHSHTHTRARTPSTYAFIHGVCMHFLYVSYTLHT